MEIHKKSNNRFIAELTKNDMDCYRLTFDELDADNPKTSFLLNDMLARLSLPFSRLAVCVDMLPDGDGGVIMLFTLRNKTKYKVVESLPGNSCCICRFRDAETVFILAEILNSLSDCHCKCRLFSDGMQYAAEITQMQIDKNHLAALLSEFGEVRYSDKLLQAELAEHYTLLCPDLIKTLKS